MATGLHLPQGSKLPPTCSTISQVQLSHLPFLLVTIFSSDGIQYLFLSLVIFTREHIFLGAWWSPTLTPQVFPPLSETFSWMSFSLQSLQANRRSTPSRFYFCLHYPTVLPAVKQGRGDPQSVRCLGHRVR